MGIIRNILRKNEYLYSILKFARKARNPEYRSLISDLNDESSQTLYLFSGGEANKDKVIYLIDYWNPLSGFFATHIYLLISLEFADSCNMAPVVRMPKDWVYGIKDEANNYELFYEQPCGISWEEAQASYRVVKYNRTHTFRKNTLYELTESDLDQLALIGKKYLRFNNNVCERVKKDIDNCLKGEKILGIHFRGSDFKQNFSEHPKFIDVNTYIKAAKELHQKNNYDKIFLATDDEEAVSVFKEEFNDLVVTYNDVHRTTTDVSIIHNRMNSQNNTEITYEVIRDMKTLAECDSLICCKSCVSICARIEKKMQGLNYNECIILDEGTNDVSANTIVQHEKKLKENNYQ